jgi:short-subunit dehydrogenase
MRRTGGEEMDTRVRSRVERALWLVMALPPPRLDTTVLVTGASAGIGSELARELARRSYNLVLVARRAERLAELAEELRLTRGIHADVGPCDLTDADARRDLVDRLETGEREVVGVCNNAGLGTVAPLVEAGVEREQQVVRLNVEALHHLTGAFLPRMVSEGAGAILNVASTAAFQPLPGFATYAASKAFVQSFSEAVHAELAGTGVSVTCLCPGFTHTEFGANAGARDEEAKLPAFLFMEAPDVAREGVEAMVAGRRSAIPGLKNRVTMLGGRAAPRSLLLPLVRQVTGRG